MCNGILSFSYSRGGSGYANANVIISHLFLLHVFFLCLFPNVYPTCHFFFFKNPSRSIWQNEQLAKATTSVLHNATTADDGGLRVGVMLRYMALTAGCGGALSLRDNQEVGHLMHHCVAYRTKMVPQDQPACSSGGQMRRKSEPAALLSLLYYPRDMVPVSGPRIEEKMVPNECKKTCMILVLCWIIVF